MKTTTAILMILAVLTASAAYAAQHPLDEAAHALSEGDVERAVETYRQANDQEPTAEGYNNLGVAL